MTLSRLDGSWTSTSTIWHDDAPFAGFGFVGAILAGGRAVIAAVSASRLLSAIAVGLGLSSLMTMFGADEPDFDQGWGDGDKFDERMAMMQQMWLKLNDRISGSCPEFQKSALLPEYQADRERFSAFYGQTGKVTSRASSYVGLTPSPSSTEVGTAKTFWATLIGWVARLEEMCPGKIAPGLAEVFKTAREKADADAEKDAGWDWKWWALGGAGVFLAALWIASKRASVTVDYSNLPPRYSEPPPGAFHGLSNVYQLPLPGFPATVSAPARKRKKKAPLSPEAFRDKMRGAADRMRANWLRNYGLDGLRRR